jgi:hypothetical protein
MIKSGFPVEAGTGSTFPTCEMAGVEFLLEILNGFRREAGTGSVLRLHRFERHSYLKECALSVAW